PASALAQHTHGSHEGHSSHADHAAHDVHAAHGAVAPATDVPADHARWTPDAAQVEGMTRVREAVATLAHHEMGHLGADNVLVLASDIDAAIEYMFANCKLDPEPDVALHGVLARLMAATRALHEAPGDASPVTTMRAA